MARRAKKSPLRQHPPRRYGTCGPAPTRCSQTSRVTAPATYRTKSSAPGASSLARTRGLANTGSPVHSLTMTGSGLVSIRTEAALISIPAAAASTLVITTAAGTATGCLTTRTVGTTPPETSGCLWILFLRIPRYQALRTMRTAPTLMEDTTGVSAVAGKHQHQHYSH